MHTPPRGKTTNATTFKSGQKKMRTRGACAAAELDTTVLLAASEVDGLEPPRGRAGFNQKQGVAHALLEQEVGRLHIAVNYASLVAGSNNAQALVQNQRCLPLCERAMVLRVQMVNERLKRVVKDQVIGRSQLLPIVRISAAKDNAVM